VSTGRPLLLGSVVSVVLVLGVLAGVAVGRRPLRAAAAGVPDTSLRSMEAVLRRDGLGAALDSLERRATRDSSVLRGGHQMAHALGREAVDARGGDASVIRECRPAFGSGCYHGVVEAALNRAGHLDVAELERLCAEIETASGPGATYECLHGVGHGVLGAVKYDLASALRYCDALSTGRRVESCRSGAFMEAIGAAMGAPMLHQAHAHDSGHAHMATLPLAIDPADPYSPCAAYHDPYANACWLFQGFVILRANDFDAARALHVCDGAPDGRAGRCYESVGHQLTGLFQHDDAWILGQCARGSPALAARCAGGATLALNAMDWSGKRGVRLCAAAPADWKADCYRTAAGALVDLATVAQRADLCAAVEPTYARLCREAAEVERVAVRQ
jgi:uncharacterized membrane protein